MFRLAADAVLVTQASSTDANGGIQVADNAAAVRIRVTDRYGNTVTTPIP